MCVCEYISCRTFGTGFACRMKSTSFLFLLFCFTLGKSELQVQEDRLGTGLDRVRMPASVPPDLSVLLDELWGLKELVLSLKAAEVEQRQARRSMESRLRDREVEAEQQRRSLQGLEEMLVHQREELRDTQVKTDLNSDLRRKVEELEEQSKGGGK